MSRELIFQSTKPILNESTLKVSLADHVDPVCIIKIKINKSKKKAYVTLNNTQYNQVLSNADAFYIEDEAISISPTTVTTNELYDEIQSLKQLVLTMKESLNKKIQTCTDFLKKNQTRDAWDREYDDPPYGDFTAKDFHRIDGGAQGYGDEYNQYSDEYDQYEEVNEDEEYYYYTQLNPPYAREVAQPYLVLPPNYPSNPTRNTMHYLRIIRQTSNSMHPFINYTINNHRAKLQNKFIRTNNTDKHNKLTGIARKNC
eukprot:590382_1